LRQSAVSEEALEGGNGDVLARCVEGFALEPEARGLVCDREGVAVAAVADLELALVFAFAAQAGAVPLHANERFKFLHIRRGQRPVLAVAEPFLVMPWVARMPPKGGGP
jgi:hypothetical protein